MLAGIAIVATGRWLGFVESVLHRQIKKAGEFTDSAALIIGIYDRRRSAALDTSAAFNLFGILFCRILFHLWSGYRVTGGP